jgi:long-chain acyl-CoA synthetase
VESVLGVQTDTARNIHRSDHTERRLPTAPRGCCVRKATGTGANEQRGPLLLIAGGEDHVVPAAVDAQAAKKYGKSRAVTDFKEFPGRSHFGILGGRGWEEVADYTLDWAVRSAGVDRALCRVEIPSGVRRRVGSPLARALRPTIDRNGPARGERSTRMTSTIGEILPVAAQRFGARTALVVGDRSVSFDELQALSSRAAHGLVAVGVRPGDRVALYGPNCWEWLVAYYAIAKTGAVVIPVNVMLTPDEVRFVVEDSGTRAVVASADKGEPLLDLRGTGHLQDVVLWGEEIPAGATAFADWLTDGRAEFSPVERDGGDLAAICYTSGTTGRPKGAMQSQRAVIGAAVGTAVMAARGPDDRVINSLPLPHVYGSCVFNAAMMAGSTLIMVPRFDAETVLRTIGEHRATLMDGVPTAYYYLLAHPDFERYDLSSLTRCWVGGQTLPAAKAIEFTERTGCPIHEVWGMTELAGATSANPVVGPNKPGTIGIAYPGNAMRVVDIADPAREMPVGERGELMFRGPLVMLGYYGNEAGTAATIEPDGWLHTGDVATMDEDGYFTIVDRMKDMILTAGFNVYPAEIERVLCAHPTVALAAVGGIPDETKGELAKAYVVLKPAANVSREELIAHCREHLAAYKVPRAIQFTTQVPMTSSGKIMRRLLTDIDDGTRTTASDPTPVAT